MPTYSEGALLRQVDDEVVEVARDDDGATLPRFAVADWWERKWSSTPMGAACSFSEMLEALYRDGVVVVVEGRGDATRG